MVIFSWSSLKVLSLGVAYQSPSREYCRPSAGLYLSQEATGSGSMSQVGRSNPTASRVDVFPQAMGPANFYNQVTF